MKKLSVSLFAFMMLLLAMTWAGCSKPPEAEKEAARKAMENAISAGADTYTPAETEAAKKAWEMAELQMNEKKYKEAKQGYIEARASWEKAAGAIEAGKKVVADQTKETLTALEKAWKKLGTTSKKFEKKLKEKKKVWMADAKTIEEGFAKAKEMMVQAPLEAKAKLEELKPLIGKWENTFKEMTKAKPKAKSKTKSQPAKKKK